MLSELCECVATTAATHHVVSLLRALTLFVQQIRKRKQGRKVSDLFVLFLFFYLGFSARVFAFRLCFIQSHRSIPTCHSLIHHIIRKPLFLRPTQLADVQKGYHFLSLDTNAPRQTRRKMNCSPNATQRVCVYVCEQQERERSEVKYE